MTSRHLKAHRSITTLCFAVDASDQSVSRYCKRVVPTVSCVHALVQILGHTALPATHVTVRVEGAHGADLVMTKYLTGYLTT
jgi:hypothetical protein